MVHWANLSEPHTSDKNGIGVTFTKMYVEIQSNGTIVKSLRLKIGLKLDNLQMLLVVFIMRTITRVVY